MRGYLRCAQSIDRSQIKTKALSVWREWSFPVTTLAISRLILYLSFLFAAKYLPLARENWNVPEQAIRPLNRWDAWWYLSVAEHGYDYQLMPGQHPAAFFPLYPILIKTLHSLTRISLPWSGIIISNLALLAALHTISKAIESDHGREVAERTLIYLAIFPTSLFFSTIYTESLFLFLAASSLCQMRRDHWLRSSPWVLLASLTRPTGVVLALPSIWAFAQSVYKKKVSWIRLAPLGAVLIGIGSYMTYLQIKFGDALLFYNTQRVSGWGRSFGWERMKNLPTQVTLALTSLWWPEVERFDVLFFFVFLLLIVVSFRYLPKVYCWFSLGALLLPISTGTFSSMSRFVVVIFPCFAVVALLSERRPRLHLAIVLISTTLLVCYSMIFSRWYWVD
jgi:hypothetical protein